MSLRPLRAVGLVLLVVSVSACSGAGKSEVSGKVTFKGAPVTSGEVQIMASDGTIASGEIRSDGTYTVQGVLAGSHRVAITNVDEKAANEYFLALAGRSSKGGDPIGPDGKPRPKGSPPLERSAFSKIPAKYGEYDTSGLTVEVKGSKVTKDFAID